MKIVVSFDYPPIPVRDMDYSAVDDNTYDGAPDSDCPVGRGASEEAALRDLAEFWPEETEEDLARYRAEATAANDGMTLRFLDLLAGEFSVGGPSGDPR